MMQRGYKQIMQIGKPLHYRPNNNNISACGVISPEYSVYDPRDCNCINCMKTKAYRASMGKY